MLAASLRREFNDAATLISGCGVIGGALTWVGARIWMVISRKEVDLERWVLDGAGGGAILGIVGVFVDLVL
ncbi:MAG: hypothetical protein ACRDH9_01805 [Actinomycetota bacterium]